MRYHYGVPSFTDEDLRLELLAGRACWADPYRTLDDRLIVHHLPVGTPSACPPYTTYRPDTSFLVR